MQRPRGCEGAAVLTSCENYCGLREALADAAPAASTDVLPFPCDASSVPAPFAAKEPLLVAAVAPPVPAKFAESIGFDVAVLGAEAAPLELTAGFCCATRSDWAACSDCAATSVVALAAV